MPDKGSRPSKKPGGRTGPPPRYPKDQEKYADPENWKYPVHSPAHARSARRYFNTESNRAKYDEDERQFIDNRIDEALRRFGVALKVKGGTVEPEEGTLEDDIPSDKELESMDRGELLHILLGEARMRRAKGIRDSQLSFSDEGDSIEATVKRYRVYIDIDLRKIAHDCIDWKRRSSLGLFCKHMGKVLLSLPEERAAELLKGILKNRDSWEFEFTGA